MGADRQAKMAVEKKRREQVVKEQTEEAQKIVEQRASKEEKEKIEQEEMLVRAKGLHKEQQEKEEEFCKALKNELPELRKAAEDLMEADYGTSVAALDGKRKGLPLRLLTRRKEIAWIWA